MKPQRKLSSPILPRSSYVQNKCAQVVPFLASGVPAFKVEAPVKGEGLRRTVVKSDSAPDVFKILSGFTAFREPRELTFDAGEFDALEKLGFLVPVAKHPQRVVFSCKLEDASLLQSADSTALAEEFDNDALTDWKVNVNSRVDVGQESRDQLTGLLRPVARFGADAVGWIEDPCRHLSLPYWLTEFEADCARELLSGDLAPQELDKDLRRKFAVVGLIFTNAWLRHNRRKWQAKCSKARRDLAGRGYAVLRDLIPPVFLESIRQYYRKLVTEGFLVFGDDQTARYNLHNEPFLCWLHRQIGPLIYRAVPENIKPSYSYVSVYPSGATLERHTDRIQCEYTLTLAIDATPDFTRAQAWPLYVESPQRRTTKILLGPGDGLILKGRELAHFRNKLGAGRTSSSLLFHYVPANFAGPLLAGRWINSDLAPGS